MRGIRHRLLLSASLALLPSVSFAADPYSEFRIPEARSFSSLVNASGQWNSNDRANTIYHSESRNSLGTLSALARWHAESEPHTSDLLLTANGDWRSTSSRDDLGGGSSFDGHNYNYTARVIGATTRYWGDSAWGLDALADASYVYARNGFTNASSTVIGGTGSSTTSATASHDYQGTADLVLGPGYGRIRDVTGVFDMQVLEERLEATGRLRHPLSPAARQRLAELFSVSGEFLAAHDRPDRFFWREVERLLREDDAIEAGTFDAWSLMRALEPATLSVAITRRAGWRVWTGYELLLERGHYDYDQDFLDQQYSGGVIVSSSENSSSHRLDLDQTTGFARLDAAVHRPFGMRWQADLAGTVRYGDGPHRELVLRSDLGLSYVLADRWLATGAFSSITGSDYVDGARLSPFWTVRSSGQLSYFFEDSWSAFAGVDQLQARPKFTINDVPMNPQGYERQTQVQIGLSYRPAGRFEARGLGVSQRPVPGGF